LVVKLLLSFAVLFSVDKCTTLWYNIISSRLIFIIRIIIIKGVNMARRKRDNLKRLAAQAFNNLDRGVDDLMELRAEFEQHHIELANELEQIATMAYTVILLLEKFTLKCWQIDIEWLKSYSRRK
jgi:hypothetical protein